MRVLLDTHALIWFALGDARLTSTAKAVILDPGNDKWVSPANYWEIAIKVSLGKLALHQPYDDFIDKSIRGNGFDILPVEPRHTSVLVGMPFHHKDPFDRLLAAQALVEGVPIVSNDAVFDAYGVQRLW